MLGSDISFDKVFEHHLRDFDAVEGDGIDVDVPLSAGALGVSFGFDLMAAAEHRHEGIPGIAAAGDFVEVDHSGGVDDPGLAMHPQLLYTLRQSGASGSEPGIKFTFADHSGRSVGIAARTVFADVIELVLGTESWV